MRAISTACILFLALSFDGNNASGQEWNLEDEGDWYHAAIASTSDFAELSWTCYPPGKYGLAFHHPDVAKLPDNITIEIDRTPFPVLVKRFPQLSGTIFFVKNLGVDEISSQLNAAIRRGKSLEIKIPAAFESKFESWKFPLTKAPDAYRFLAENCEGDTQ